MNIFVGNLSFKTSEDEIQKEFETFGEVDSVKIILDHETHKSRGFGFVTMPNQDQALAAIAGLNGREINGFAIKVNESRPREPGAPSRPRTGGGYNQGGAGFGSGSGSSGGGYNKKWISSVTDSRDLDIYDTKGGRGGGPDRRGRGGSGNGSGGRSGRGRRSY